MDIRQRQTTSPPPKEHCIDVDESGSRHPWIPMLRKLIWLGVIGVGLSLYLVSEHYADGGTMCDINAIFSCSRVNQSRFAVLFGVPVAVWGVLWNVLLVLVAKRSSVLLHHNVLKDAERIKSYLFLLYVWALAGVAFVVYFVAAEAILHALCIFCTLVHVVVLAVFFYVRGVYSQARLTIPLLDHAVALRGWLAGLGVTALALVLLFNTLPSNVLEPQVPHALPVAVKQVNTTAVTAITTNTTTIDTYVHDTSELAKCMSRNGFKMFGSMSCGHCLQQKALFGAAFGYINFVSCDNRANCAPHKITGYPTWLQVVDGKERFRHSGVLPLTVLGNLSHCILQQGTGKT